MKKSLLIIATLLATQLSQANNDLSLADVKKILTEQEYMQYTHEIWQKDRKKAEVTDYSELLKNNQFGNTLTVGPGNDCGFPNILTAINFAAPGDTIMIAEGTYVGVEAKLFINKDLTLVGGLDSTCQVFTSNRTKLILNDAGPVVELDVSGGKNVTISGLDIGGAQQNIIHDYNSGIHVTGNGTVTIGNTLIHNNEAYDGGGLSVIENATVIIKENTEIFNNSSERFGAGIYCGSSTLRIFDTKIGRFNQGDAQGNILLGPDNAGGGIYANSCDVKLGETEFGNGPVEINYNKAKIGVGIYALNSNIVYSNVGSRISFNERYTDGILASGTAIYAAGDSSVRLIDINVTDQYAGSTFSIRDESYFIMYSQCQDSICSDVRRNAGTVIFVTDNAEGVIRRTLIEENTTSSEMFITTANASLTIENVIFSQSNTTFTNHTTLFFAKDNSILNVSHVTVANNEVALDYIFKTEDTAELNFNAGIIWGNNSSEMVLNESNNFNLSDSIIQYNPAGLVNTTQADPLFASDTNFHIRGNSPAIDHVEVTILGDIDRDSRPEGIKSDAGADEFVDLIYKNSFE